MELVNSICEDIRFYEDKVKIIKKYLVPKIIEAQSFENISNENINIIFNVVDYETLTQIKIPIEEIIQNPLIEEFVETNWKIGNCFNCKKLRPMNKCKDEHDEECEYSEITSPEGCSQSFCDECIFHVCSNTHDCPAVRCQSCSEM